MPLYMAFAHVCAAIFHTCRFTVIMIIIAVCCKNNFELIKEKKRKIAWKNLYIILLRFSCFYILCYIIFWISFELHLVIVFVVVVVVI